MVRASCWAVVVFHDGLGERRLSTDSTGATVETLFLRRELSVVPSFEFALRERVSRLSGFRHAYYGHARSIDRTSDADQVLTITSDATPGIRLSDLLNTSHERHLPIDLDASLCLIRQLVPAIAILHESARDVAHGALSPERLVVTPNGRVVIVEYVLGSALEQLLYSRDRYWSELRIALPRVAGLPRFDHLADVTQLGVIAISLLMGRTLRDDEYPARIGDVVSSTMAISAHGQSGPLPPGLRGWLTRALQLDTRHSFPSAIEARTEFERILTDSGCDASPESLDRFLARYQAHEAQAPTVAAPTARHSVPSAVKVTEPREHKVVPEPSEQMHAHDAPEVDAPVHHKPSRRGRLVTMAAAAVVVVALLAGGALVGAPRFLANEPLPSVTGTLVVTTNPAGAIAIVDGVSRGTTPLTLTLAAGSHEVQLRGEGEPRTIPVNIAPGAQMAQYVDMPKAAPAAVVHEDAAAEAAAKAALAPLTDAATVPGWITVEGKIEVQLYEADRLLGSSQIDRIMVPAGRHDLELVNDVVGYRGTRTVQVSPGKVTTVMIDPPKGTIAINAQPWAEVWVDGTKVGETPIGNFAVAAGSHDVVFRHPDLGEHRETVLVTLKNPMRLSVDMRKP